MPVPILCLDESLRQLTERFRHALSKPQYQDFVIVLLGLMLCEGRRTVHGLLRQIADGPSWAGVSRFLSQAPWQATAVGEVWLDHFREEMPPEVAAEVQRQRREHSKRQGRPKLPLVTGYLIGDDSTIEKRTGKKMEGVGMPHSATQDKRVRGHSLVESLEVLLGRRCPLAPQLYRQQAACAAEGVPFASKIALMVERIRSFEPVPGTRTHVRLESWYSAKVIWQVARERGFHMTSGLKSNRGPRVEDPAAPQGWSWQRLSDSRAQLSANEYIPVKWPKGDKDVYVHVISTRGRKLYCCPVVIVRQSLDAPLAQAPAWAASDLEASPELLLWHSAARWDIEVLFGDGKEELGLDPYQLMRATALVRFWTLAMLAYVFLEEEGNRWQSPWQRPVTIGEARREIQPRHRRHLLDWLHGQFQSGVEPEALYELLSA